MLLLVSSFVFALPSVDLSEVQLFGVLVSFVVVGITLVAVFQTVMAAAKNAKSTPVQVQSFQSDASTVTATTEIQVSPVKKPIF
jgi:hypothetical protein